MKLPEWGEGEILGTDGGLKAAAVFEDVFASVPVGEAEVEDSFAIEIADAAGTSAEAVNEPGEILEGGESQNLKTASVG